VRRFCGSYPFILVLLTLFLVAIPLGAATEATLKCPICGMKFKPSAKTSFEATHEGKELQVCSFACARRLRKKYEKDPLYAHDFHTLKKIDSTSAFFLIKSKNLLKELDFDMPPSVVAFSVEADAKKVRDRLMDGEIVNGFAAMEKAYE
jgi:YHS domain-containing protein